MKRESDILNIDGLHVAVNPRWDAKWTRAALLLGLLDEADHELLALIQHAMPVQALRRKVPPGHTDDLARRLERLASHGLITLLAPPKDETPGLVAAWRSWNESFTNG